MRKKCTGRYLIIPPRKAARVMAAVVYRCGLDPQLRWQAHASRRGAPRTRPGEHTAAAPARPGGDRCYRESLSARANGRPGCREGSAAS